jgi:hypothetical protein
VARRRGVSERMIRDAAIRFPQICVTELHAPAKLKIRETTRENRTCACGPGTLGKRHILERFPVAGSCPEPCSAELQKTAALQKTP